MYSLGNWTKWRPIPTWKLIKVFLLFGFFLMMGHCGKTRRKMFTEKSTTRGKTDKMIPQNNQGINGKVKK
jgi:hypothetical protein